MNTYLQDLLTAAINDNADEWVGGNGFADKHGAGVVRSVRRRRTLAHAATGTGTLAAVGAVAWGAVAQPWAGAIANPAAAGPCASETVTPDGTTGSGYAIVTVMGDDPETADRLTLRVGATGEVENVAVYDQFGNPVDKSKWSWDFADGLVSVVMSESGETLAVFLNSDDGKLGVSLTPGPTDPSWVGDAEMERIVIATVEDSPSGVPSPSVTCVPSASPSFSLRTATYEVVESPLAWITPSEVPAVESHTVTVIELSPAPGEYFSPMVTEPTVEAPVEPSPAP